EDGIRDFHVTGVQTCALPILVVSRSPSKYPGKIVSAKKVIQLASCTGRKFGTPASTAAQIKISPSAISASTRTKLCKTAGHVTRSEERRVGKESRTNVDSNA